MSLLCCLIILMALLDDSLLLLHADDVIFDDIVELLGHIGFDVVLVVRDFSRNILLKLAYCSN